ncbi:MAG: hypothetical protein ACK424_08380, partial [Candidatus Thermochlorobacter sp.]
MLFADVLFAQARVSFSVLDASKLQAEYEAERDFQAKLQGERVSALQTQVHHAAIFEEAPARMLRSPALAGIFSAIVPGAGEFYAESYLRAGLFVAIEAALWIFHVQLLDRGNRAAQDYKAFADAPSALNDGLSRWSAVRYASRLSQIFREHPNPQLRTLAQELSAP